MYGWPLPRSRSPFPRSPAFLPPRPLQPTPAATRACLVSSVSSPYQPMRSSPLAALLSKSVGAVGPPSLTICRACQRTLASSATTFDDGSPAPSRCALAEKDLRPSPPLPSLPRGVCDLTPDGGLVSVLLMSAQPRTAHSSDRVASVWSRLIRVAPRWWCRWRRTGGVIAGVW